MNYIVEYERRAMVTLLIRRLEDTAFLPTKGSRDAAGYDLYSNQDVIVPAWSQELVGTGIAMSLPRYYWGEIWPRSGLDAKNGVTTGAGVIDSDYRGEVMVLLRNLSDSSYHVRHGDRIAQMIISKHYGDEVVEVPAFSEDDETERGEDGIGSTGR